MPVVVDELSNVVSVSANPASIIDIQPAITNINIAPFTPSITTSQPAPTILQVTANPTSALTVNDTPTTVTEIQMGGSVGLDNNTLIALAMDPETLIIGSIVRSPTEALISATVRWPDGTTGTFTGTESIVTPGAVDSYVITYNTHTFTQPTVTRDGSGAVITRPSIVFS